MWVDSVCRRIPLITDEDKKEGVSIFFGSCICSHPSQNPQNPVMLIDKINCNFDRKPHWDLLSYTSSYL
jgi:hypothetical protein